MQGLGRPRQHLRDRARSGLGESSGHLTSAGGVPRTYASPCRGTRPTRETAVFRTVRSCASTGRSATAGEAATDTSVPRPSAGSRAGHAVGSDATLEHRPRRASSVRSAHRPREPHGTPHAGSTRALRVRARLGGARALPARDRLRDLRRERLPGVPTDRRAGAEDELSRPVSCDVARRTVGTRCTRSIRCTPTTVSPPALG